MRIEDAAVIKRFRMATKCELCGHTCHQGCHPHHAFSRGAGRCDVTANLIALCPDLVGNSCHRRFHDGKISLKEILDVIAAREHTEAWAIEAAVQFIRRLPKGASPEKIRLIAEQELSGPVEKLVARSLRESVFPDF